MNERYGWAKTEVMRRSIVPQAEALLREAAPTPPAHRPPAREIKLEGTDEELENLIAHVGEVAIRKDPRFASELLSSAEQIFNFLDGKGWPSTALTVPQRYSKELTVRPKSATELPVVLKPDDEATREPAVVQQSNEITDVFPAIGSLRQTEAPIKVKEESLWPANSGDLMFEQPTQRIPSLIDRPTEQMPPVQPDGFVPLVVRGNLTPGYTINPGLIQ